MAFSRDPFIDYLRGIAIIWVVMAHVLYFKSFFPHPLLQSYLLFEMPTIFFVSGASLYYSIAKKSSITSFLRKRMLRLLKPYYLLAAVCIPLHYGAALWRGEIIRADHVVQWLALRPLHTTPSYIEFYLWFVLVALAVSFLHPLLGWLYARPQTRHFTLGVIATGIALESYGFFQPLWDHIWVLLPQYWARLVSDTIWYAIFYSFFMYLGYYYADGQITFKRGIYLVSGLVSACLLAVVVSRGRFSAYMNANKFPPNVAYALLGLCWLSIFMFFRPAMIRFFERWRRPRSYVIYCGQHSYSIYLWHGFGFWFLDHLLRWTRTEASVSSTFYLFPLLLYFGFVLLVSYYLSKVVDNYVPA